MDLKEFRKARLAKLAKKAESQMMYNPLVQKPAHMEPLSPRGGFCYFGPMPDQGTSYGLYEDEKGNKAICMAGERVYSPYTGTEMKKVEDADALKVKEMIPAESSVGSYSCMACRTPLFLSDKKAASAMDKIYCTQCGSDMADVMAKLKTDIAGQFDPEAPKPSHEVVETPELQPVAPKEEPSVEEKKDEPKGKEEIKDENKEDKMPVEEKKEDIKVEEPKVEEPKVEEPKVEEVVEPKEVDSSSEEEVVEPKADEIVEEPVEGQKESSKEPANKEFVIPESKESTVVEEKPAEAQKESKESSTKESTVVEEKPAEAQKESSTPESKESTVVEELKVEVAPVAPSPAFPPAEPVLPLSEVPASVKAEEVHMTLYGAELENPYWNIEIQGQPVARVSLADQDNPAEDRVVFLSKEYAETLARAMEKVGAKPILDTMKAKYFVNKVDGTALADKIRSEIKAELEKEHKDKLAALRNDFIDSLNIATSAINKNWYTEEGHALKEALYARMDKAGVYDPIEIIEGAFEESSGEYFNHLFNKAVEIMNKHPEARAELRETLSKTNTIPVQASAVDVPRRKMSLAEKLENASFNLQAAGAGEQKEDLKSLIKNKVRLGYRK